jgi:hypothetical protein
MNPGKCERCQKRLHGRRSDARFCSAACAQAFRRASRYGSGVVATTNGDAPAAGTGELAELAARLRRMLLVLADGPAALTVAQARWIELTRRVLSDLPLIERLERVQIELSKAGGEVLAAMICRCLEDNGVNSRDPEVRDGVARRIREMVAADRSA